MIQKARRITREEKTEANLQLFEQLGLGIEEVKRMAESVDLEVDDLLLLNTRVSVSARPRHIMGKPGRKNTTQDIADFSAIRRLRLMTWKQIFDEWQQHHPNDVRVKGTETMREAYRRHYGDKFGKGY